MLKRLELEEIDTVKPITVITRDDESGILKIQIYEDEIIISTGNQSWFFVDEAKRELEKNINPYNKLWKYTKGHISYLFLSLSKMFK